VNGLWSRLAVIEGQTAIIEQMHERIQELEARLAKDSHNSSRPPSSDSSFKKSPPRSRANPVGASPVDNRVGAASPTPWSMPPISA